MRGIITKAITKLSLLAGLFMLMVGGCAVENDMWVAFKLALIGIGLAIPEVVINMVEWYRLDEDDKK
jgi:hypothetical protein